MFKLFKQLYGEKRYGYNLRALAYLRLQKVVDATEQVRVREIEKEEALKKMERLLESYLPLF